MENPVQTICAIISGYEARVKLMNKGVTAAMVIPPPPTERRDLDPMVFRIPKPQTPSSNRNCATRTRMTDTPSSRRSSMPTAYRNIPLSFERDDVPEKEGEGKPRVHPICSNGQLIDTFDDNIRTLYDAFQYSTKKYATSPFLGWRPKADGVAGPYEWMTYEQVERRVRNFAAGLASLNLSEKCNVGIYSINRPEWVLSEYACFYNNFVTVPLYDTLGDEAVTFICEQTEMTILVASNDKALNILRLKDKIKNLNTIVCMDEEIQEELRKKAESVGVKLIKFKELEKEGEATNFTPRPPKPEDLCTICYTSGTTGLPKGVMLPHIALLADASAVLSLAGIGKHADKDAARFLFKLGPQVVHVSYLPLAHVYERVVLTTLAIVGASIGFYQGDIMKLMDDIAILKPTVFITVPRLLSRIYDKIIAGVNASGSFKKFLFNFAYKSKAQNLKTGGTFDHWLWDKLVFSVMRNKLGGRVSAILTGSAPVSPEVMDFLRICFSCEVYEGYGQTETSAGTTLTSRGDWSSGQIGVPCPCNEIKLVDISDMGYTSKDSPRPRGEICVRGPNCFVGYYKSPDLTKDTLDSDGWVHTGDVGEWDERGRLLIIDRKKNLFKLAQGEYISPEKIENMLHRNKYIAQSFIEGNSIKASLVCIVVPDFETLEGWARENSVEFNSHEDLSKQSAVKDLLMSEIKKLGKNGSNELKGFEIPRDIYIEHVAFTIDNDLLTSTMKLKRHVAKKKYAKQISEMYSNIKD